MVFQDYALFPHMTVEDNVGYGLKLAGTKREQAQRRVAETLAFLDLKGLERRLPSQLSGGQQQRVALARALVMSPEVLLLDEPLSNLDARLRVSIRAELISIQRQLGLTTIYVTHDQDEALTMSDRLAVFDRGRIEQIGSPAEVYEHPANAFVAGFVGVSNVIDRDGKRFAVRPEKIRMDEPGSGSANGAHTERGHIREVVYAGMVTRYLVDLDQGGELQVVRQNLETSSSEALDAKGKQVLLQWSPEHMLEIETDSGKKEGAA
jgi:putative spermidine/putrescine transport system ATP-binding protein